eukprot:scaffold2174_cov67-Skeletonema_dohrnii-CCMP3373.AAC.3
MLRLICNENAVSFVSRSVGIGATKTHDGGAKAANDSEPSAKKTRQSVRKHQDPFMYYSDQETRMDELLLYDDNDDRVIRESDVRMTRISFELHPKLLLMSR